MNKKEIAEIKRRLNPEFHNVTCIRGCLPLVLTVYRESDGLEELMLTKPLEKIRITELCRLCDADRQMFYYHFPDK